MKYIVIALKIGKTTREVPILFPNILVHVDMYNSVKESMLKEFPGSKVTPLSAGELSLFDSDTKCNGESTTLGIGSRFKDDDMLLRMNDYGFGIY